MHRSLRRGLAAVAVVAGIFATVPGSVQAATQCGVAVCAQATATATWTCRTTDNIIPGHDLIECLGLATPGGRGYSDLSIPGSLTWSGTTESKYIYGMQTYPSPGPASAPTTCTWAGLGEDECGGSGNAVTSGVGGYIPHGACINTYFNFDVELSASSSATASKTLPLGLPQVDGATATETASAKLSDVPPAERCAFL